jgi:hypothetical protein
MGVGSWGVSPCSVPIISWTIREVYCYFTGLMGGGQVRVVSDQWTGISGVGCE